MKSRLSSLLFLLTVLIVAGCGGGLSEVRVTEGREQIGTAPKGTVIQTSAARIVHVDEIERIATIRGGNTFEEGDFIMATQSGAQTAILKIDPIRPEALRTAYILEGEPSINNVVEFVSTSDAKRLRKLYPDADAF